MAGNATGTISVLKKGIRQLCHYMVTSGHNHHVPISPAANTTHQSHPVAGTTAVPPPDTLFGKTLNVQQAVGMGDILSLQYTGKLVCAKVLRVLPCLQKYIC